jgi:uncharacterized Zn-binding protein involved in type VI secretion
MTGVQRVGDLNNLGGAITITPQSTVFANNKLIAVEGSTVSSHPPNSGLHLVANCRTANGSSNVFINNKKVVSVGKADNCGHVRGNGSSNVIVN